MVLEKRGIGRHTDPVPEVGEATEVHQNPLYYDDADIVEPVFNDVYGDNMYLPGLVDGSKTPNEILTEHLDEPVIEEFSSASDPLERARLQLQAAREMENAHMNQLRQAEQLYDAMYGPLADGTTLDAAMQQSSGGGNNSIREILREIAKTKARITTQKQSLLGVKAKRVHLEETYIQKQDELQQLVEQLEKTEAEFEKRRRSALQINRLDESIKGKLSEQSAMLAVVTDQMASSETVLEQQRRDLIKIHGEASVRKAALVHDQKSIKKLRAKYALAQQTARTKQAEAQRLEAELRNVQSMLVAEKESLAALAAQKNLSRQQMAAATAKITELSKGELSVQRATIARLRALEDVLHQAVRDDVTVDGNALYDTVLPQAVTDGLGSVNLGERYPDLHGAMNLSFLGDDDNDIGSGARSSRRFPPGGTTATARHRGLDSGATHVMDAYIDMLDTRDRHGGKDFTEALDAYHALNVGNAGKAESASDRLRREAMEVAEEILAHSTTSSLASART